MGRITIERDETAGRLRCMFTPAVPEPGEFVIASEAMEIDTIIIQDDAQDVFMAPCERLSSDSPNVFWHSHLDVDEIIATGRRSWAKRAYVMDRGQGRRRRYVLCVPVHEAGIEMMRPVRRYGKNGLVESCGLRCLLGCLDAVADEMLVVSLDGMMEEKADRELRRAVRACASVQRHQNLPY